MDLTDEPRRSAGSGARLRIGGLDGTTRDGTWTRNVRGGLMDLWRHPKEATSGSREWSSSRPGAWSM